jgi:recombination protein RecA
MDNDRMELIQSLQKKIKGMHISLLTESDIANVSDIIKTPALDLNRILSGDIYKGIPSKNLVGIVGKYGTFKSSFSALCMAESLEHGYQPIIIDTEGAFSAEFCTRWGLDISKVIYVSETYVENVLSFLAQLKERNQQKMIICIDSVGGLDRYKAFTDALSNDPKLDQGQLQRNIKQMLKLLLNICIHQDSIGILTSHLYAKPGAYVTTDEIAGGESIKHIPSILIKLKKTQLKDGKDTIGSEITATTIKNRMYPPFQDATVRIDYIKGIQKYAGLLAIAEKAGLVKKSGSWYSYGDIQLGQGAEATEENLGKFPDLLEKLNEWLKTTRYSTVTKDIGTEFDSIIPTEEEEKEEEPKKLKKKKG